MLPGEVTAKGQFLDQLKIFLENNGGAKDRQDVYKAWFLNTKIIYFLNHNHLEIF
jgi:hypothetical protein